MDNGHRIANYRDQTGSKKLTEKQRKRIRAKKDMADCQKQK